MKCLVTGATGFIGRQLCHLLAEHGHQVLAYSRAGQPLDDGSATQPVDFRHESISETALAAADVVFHLAGIAHQNALAADYETVNYRASVELARRACSAGVQKFLFLSSVKAMGEGSAGQERAESDCSLPQDAYGLSKWQAEAAINRDLGDAANSICIIRPALVYGQQPKGNLATLARAVALGLPEPPEIGARSMIGVNDLCRLLLVLAAEGHAGVSTYIATDGERYSTQRIYRAIRRAQGRPPARHWCPRWVWRAGSAVLDVRNSGAAQSTWDKLFGSELYSNTQVLRSTSWRPADQLEDILAGQGIRP